jgi:4-hydroxy-tetrahydrodipicolinate synthase
MDFNNMKKKMDRCFFPAVPIPFTKEGNMHLEAQEAYANYMDTQPVSGIALWAHTGRGLLISKELREYTFKSWRKALSPDKMIICGAGSRMLEGISEEEYLNNTLEMARHAKELGADALLCYPPVFYRDCANQDDKIIEYHKKIAELQMPMVLFYLYKEAGGISYSEAVLEALFNIENVIGIKMATLDSVMTYQNVSNLIKNKFPDTRLITGEDRMYGYTLARGGCGSLVGLGAACQKLQSDMMDAYFNEDYSAFVKLMVDVDKLAECTFITPMEGYIQKMLYILYLQGIIPEEAVNDPYGPGLTAEEKENIKKVLSDLGQL